MSGAPTILYCVGATKAGTSWLYRALHDRPDVSLSAVKELHYWDTFDATERDKQVVIYERRLAQFRRDQAQAEVEGKGWKVRNYDRRIADMAGLIAVLKGERAGDEGYHTYLHLRAGDETGLVGDLTPNYAMVDDATLERAVGLSPLTKVIYLIRDPLARLWSHIRMQAERQLMKGQAFEEKANNTLWRILNQGQETHILHRGDYPATITRLRRIVPEGRLLVEFAEKLFTAKGLARVCAFLGIDSFEADGERRIHEGPKATMRPNLVAPARAFLQPQYDWVEDNVGPLPPAWAANHLGSNPA